MCCQFFVTDILSMSSFNNQYSERVHLVRPQNFRYLAINASMYHFLMGLTFFAFLTEFQPCKRHVTTDKNAQFFCVLCTDVGKKERNRMGELHPSPNLLCVGTGVEALILLLGLAELTPPTSEVFKTFDVHDPVLCFLRFSCTAVLFTTNFKWSPLRLSTVLEGCQ